MKASVLILGTNAFIIAILGYLLGVYGLYLAWKLYDKKIVKVVNLKDSDN